MSIILLIAKIGTFQASNNRIVKRQVNSTFCTSLSSVNFTSFETSVCLKNNEIEIQNNFISLLNKGKVIFSWIIKNWFIYK